MRKFSKKIAMMMVLAMLVSMFSGIVSASAASVWSAKSVDDDNYAVVMGETIEVKKGEFIDFDLFKADEDAMEAGYKYTWESSDEDVLYIIAEGKKSGYARVKGEAGDEATVSVTFTNLTTGKSATRSFDVVVVEELAEEVEEADYEIAVNFGDEPFVVGSEYDLKATITADEKEVTDAKVVFSIADKAIEGKYVPAEAGSVTILATVTIGEEEFEAEFACDVIKAELLDVKQKDAKTVELTFDVAISAAEAEKIDLYQGTVNKNVYKKNVAVKDNVVTYTSYKDFANKTEWIFKYAESEVKLTASLGDVDYVVIDGPGTIYTNPVKAENKTVDIKVSYYDANDVKVSKPDKAWIEWKVDTKLAVISNNQITAVKANEIVEISGVYHSNEYKAGENGQYAEYKCDIAPFEIKILESDAANIVGIASAKVGTAEDKQIATLPANRYDYKLYVTFKMDDGKDKKASELANISYETTDEAKLIVDPTTGALIPLAANTTVKVIVNTVVNKETVPVGAVDVVIGPNVAANDPTYLSYKSVSNSKNLDQKAEFEFKGKDNYGSDVTYSIKGEVKALSIPGSNEEAKLKEVVTKFVTVAGNKITVSAKGMTTGTYVFEAEIQNNTGDNKTWKKTFSVYVEDGNSDYEVKSVALVPTKTEYDTTITKDTKLEALDGAISYKIIGYNAKGVAVEEIVTGCAVTVKLNGNKVTDLNLYQKQDDASKGNIVVSGAAYKAIANGAYLFEGSYKKDANTELKFTPVTVTVKGAQAAPAISFEKNEVTVNSASAKSDLAAQLTTCFKAPDTTNNNDYKYEKLAVAIGDVKTTIVDGSQAGTYVAHVSSVTVSQKFVNSGIEVTFKVNVAKNVTVTVK